MSARPARALALVLSLLLPLLPAGAAEAPDDCSTARCHDVPLHFVDRTTVVAMSSLPGDAGAERLTVTSGSLTGRTEPLEAPLAVSMSGAFRFVIAARDPGGVRAEYHVDAIDGLGRTTTLARLTIEDAADLLDAPVGDVVDTDALVALFTRPARQVEENAGRLVGDALGTVDGNVLWNGANETDSALCGQQGTLASGCRMIHGDAGVNGSTLGGWCRASEPRMSSGLIPWSVWYAVQASHRRELFTPNERLLNLGWPLVGTPLENASFRHEADPGTSVCEDHWRHVDDAARTHGSALTGGAVPFAPPSASDAIEDATRREPAPSTDWRNVTLDVDPATPLPRAGGFVIVPDGYRLEFTVRARTNASGVPTPVALSYGTAEAPTRVVVRTSTDGAFSRLALGAETIGLGRHTGAQPSSAPSDVHDYRLDVGGLPVQVVPANSSVSFTMTLWSRNGESQTSTSAVATNDTEGGWILRITPPRVSLSREYAFEVRPLTLEPDGGLIHEGTHEGSLGPGDDLDIYTFRADHGQRFTLRLTHGAGADYALVHHARPSEGLTFWDVERTQAPGEATFSARPSQTSSIEFGIHRAHGNGAYTLTLDLDDDWNLSRAARPVADPAAPAGIPLALTGHGTSLDLIVLGGQESAVYRMDATGATLAAQRPLWGSLARTSSDELVYRSLETGRAAVVVDTPEGPAPITRGAVRFVFDAEGGLVTWDGLSLQRLRPGGDSEPLDGPDFDDMILSVAPDGTVYASGWHRSDKISTFVIDLHGGPARQAPDGLAGVQAFDEHGRGYRVLNRTLIERYDPASGRSELVAVVEDATAGSIAIAYGRLFVLAHVSFGSFETYLASAPIDVQGFPAFRAPLTPPATAELAPSAFSDEVVGLSVTGRDGSVQAPHEVHRFRFEISNSGEADAAPSTALVRVRLHLEILSVPAIPAGGSATIEFDWHAVQAAGDYDVSIEVDAADAVMERNERDNAASYETFVLVAGLSDTCERGLHHVGLLTEMDGFRRCRIGA